AIDRARRYVSGAERSPAATMPTRQRTHLCARVRGNLVLVPVASIRCLVAEDKYVVVHHEKGQVLVEDALKTLEDEFSTLFVRIHRNCLVAREHLSGVTRSADGRVLASVPGVDVELEISRRNLPSIRSLVRAL
ncbi:MAG: LytTR family DNA-binding domain-containing protein, partial [Dokdonella sp.]